MIPDKIPKVYYTTSEAAKELNVLRTQIVRALRVLNSRGRIVGIPRKPNGNIRMSVKQLELVRKILPKL